MSPARPTLQRQIACERILCQILEAASIDTYELREHILSFHRDVPKVTVWSSNANAHARNGDGGGGGSGCRRSRGGAS